MNQSSRLCVVFLLLLLVPASVALAQTDVYLYDTDVVGNVNIGVFVESGQVVLPDGSEGEGAMKWVYKGSAPEPYPQVHVWEADVERLGAECFTVDGIRFINHGTHWVKNRQALVLWYIEIPNASSRMPFEFEKDLTLSLWVDWNQDLMWSKDEKMVLEHINLQNYFPTADDVLHVYYLTSFQVPDIDDLALTKKPGIPDPAGADKGVVNLWVRGIVSYDDPDVSPDGEQVFGEVEDYRVAYMMTPRNMQE